MTMRGVSVCGSAIACLVLASGAAAQFSTDFEGPAFNASTGGTVLSGQNGWYLPSATIAPNSTDWNVFTATGNVYGINANPNGGGQFIAGRSTGALFARVHFDVDFGSAPVWCIAYDIAVAYDGTLPAAINLGSVSTNHNTLATGAYRNFIGLNNFTDVNNPSLGWKAEFNVFDSAGLALNNQSPGAAWTGLGYNQWYRQVIEVNYATNQILSTSITDLTTGVTTTATPSTWYMTQGSAPTLPAASAVRFFAGGSLGNIMAIDNVSVSAGACPAGCYPDCDTSTGVGVLDIFDFLCFQNSFANSAAYACECDTSTGTGVCDIFDFLCFQNAFAGGCP